MIAITCKSTRDLHMVRFLLCFFSDVPKGSQAKPTKNTYIKEIIAYRLYTCQVGQKVMY